MRPPPSPRCSVRSSSRCDKAVSEWWNRRSSGTPRRRPSWRTPTRAGRTPDGGRNMSPAGQRSNAAGLARRGSECSRPTVYGCAGRRTACHRGRSTARPAYITCTARRTGDDPRSWVISTNAVLSVAWMRWMTSRIFLHGDVVRRRRLSGDQQGRVVGDRHGDHHTLAHAARELVRVLPGASFGCGMPTRSSSSTARPSLRSCSCPGASGSSRRSVADAQHRVQRRQGVLEDHRHPLAAQAPAVFFFAPSSSNPSSLAEPPSTVSTAADPSGRGTSPTCPNPTRRRWRRARRRSTSRSMPRTAWTMPDMRGERDPEVGQLRTGSGGAAVGWHAIDRFSGCRVGVRSSVWSASGRRRRGARRP